MAKHTRHRCRACGGAFHPRPLLRFDNMPGAAQYLPDADSLKHDHGQPLDVWQCAACGLVQLSGAPVPYYREVVRAAAFSAAMGEFRRGQLGAFVARHGLGGKRGVEIGCGRGEYLALLQAQGVAAHGVEYAPAAVAACRDQGLAVERGFVDKRRARLKHAPFDACFMFNFLEHLPRPVQTLAGIAHNLSSGAVGLVEVPNFDMMLAKGLFSEFIADHLFYFTQESLTGVLSRSGFVVEACEPVWHGYILSATVRKRSPTDLSPLSAPRERLKEALHRYLDRFPPGRVAVWGAGHQALALLSLLELAPRVAYVVDSAPFKQGKFTPATHRPIVSPARLREEPVAAVVVMAAAYSDEVARLLRRDYDPALGVVIVRPEGLEEVPGQG